MSTKNDSQDCCRQELELNEISTVQLGRMDFRCTHHRLVAFLKLKCALPCDRFDERVKFISFIFKILEIIGLNKIDLKIRSRTGDKN